MARCRTGHGPLDWRDDGPSVASSRRPTYATRNAEPVGSMVPVLTSGANFENRHRVKPPRAFSIHEENRVRPTCGVVMRLVGEPCHRAPGHVGGNGGGHRSQLAMEHDAKMRRSNRRLVGVV